MLNAPIIAMKNKSFLNLGSVIFILAALFISSCAKDDSVDPNRDDRDKFVGDWTCKETPSGQAPVTFTISISKSGVSDTLLVKNFNQLGTGTQTIFLVVDNSITIPFQTITSVDILGSGLYSNDKLNLTYTADSDQLTAVCSR